MSCSSTPSQGTVINWTNAPSHANTVIDTQTNSVNMADTWYHNLICANSFRFFVQPRYDVWGSDHIRVRLWKFNLNTSKWEVLKEVNYLNGKDNHSLWININFVLAFAVPVLISRSCFSSNISIKYLVNRFFSIFEQ